MYKYLLFVSHSYAYSILRPIQAEIRRRGHEAAWWIENTSPCLLEEGERRLHNLKEVREFQPRAVFAPGNWVYPFFPGVKVEVFHGYPMRKRIEAVDDHFHLRGYWDIYCTQGPSSTPYFTQLSKEKKYFRIYETGWSKVDSFVGLPPEPVRERPCILYAPTFSKNITSAYDLAPAIDRMAESEPWDWIITFHPLLTDPELIATYEAIARKHKNVDFRRLNKGVETFRESDVLLCDSSSLIVEYLMLDKPAVTLRNTHPGPFLLDVKTPEEVAPAIREALRRPAPLMEAIHSYTAYHEAHRDGQNSARILDAVEDFLIHHQGRIPRKPLNLIRTLRMFVLYLKNRKA